MFIVNLQGRIAYQGYPLDEDAVGKIIEAEKAKPTLK